MTTWSNVGSKLEDGLLVFFSKTSGNDIARFDPDNDSFVMENVPVATGSRSDVDTQDMTLTAARIAGGIVVHTSTTGGGTVTLDTGANIGSGIPELNVAGRYMDIIFVNDGDQVDTLASASGATVADTGQTVGANEAALLRVFCTDTNTFTIFAVGA